MSGHVQHWTIRFPEDVRTNGYTTYFTRGDPWTVYVELWTPRSQMERLVASPEFYAAWRSLAEASMDRYEDEARCKETGGHEMKSWGDQGDKQCVKCLHMEWGERPTLD